MKKLLVIISIALLALCVSIAGAARSGSALPKTRVLVVSGLIIDYEENMFRDLSLVDLRKFFLETAKLDKDMVTFLIDENSTARLASDGVSGEAQVLAAARKLADEVAETDRFIFYYIGQANIIEDKLRLNIPGKDITHDQLADALGGIRASSKLIVLDCPGAGLAIRSLAGEGSIVIAGARSDQPYGTRLSQYFVPSLADPNSDANTDGRVSVLEAFTAACKQIDEFYDSQTLFKIENAMLEDDGDGVGSQRPWKYEEEGHDGEAADKYFLCE